MVLKRGPKNGSKNGPRNGSKYGLKNGSRNKKILHPHLTKRSLQSKNNITTKAQGIATDIAEQANNITKNLQHHAFCCNSLGGTSSLYSSLPLSTPNSLPHLCTHLRILRCSLGSTMASMSEAASQPRLRRNSCSISQLLGATP